MFCPVVDRRRKRMLAPQIWPITTFLVLTLAAPALADTFQLKDGRVISGRVANATRETVGESTENVWTVEIETGVFIKIYDSTLKANGRQKPKDVEEEYLAKIKSMEETADAHFELAGWCDKVGLRDLQAAHYARALDLDPNHTNARATLGYKSVNGRWTKKDEIMREKLGKVTAGKGGGWRFPESLALEQAKEDRNAKVVAATKDIFRLHNEAIKSTGNRQSQAYQKLQSVNDPLSVSAFAELLKGSKKPSVAETPQPMKLLYVQIISRFENYEAAATLAHASVTDSDSQVRNAALDGLRNFGKDVAVQVYLSYLASQDNDFVNRAAEGIGLFGGEESVLPLINAVTTKHPHKTGGGNPMVSNQGLAFGGKEKVELVDVPNASVVGALSQLTRQNFRYDRPAWLAWYASMYAPPADDLRRDP
jgi:hypothetical protein